jgi:plasmid stabilization system protein ParE
MNTEQGFTLHPGAAQDITDIWEFIVEDNPLAARRVREDILDAVRKLVPFPHQGHKRPDLTTKPLRFQAVRNYIIAYAPEERRLWCSPCCMVAAVLA